MTTRIYIRGDIGDPLNLRVYDADTDVQLDDVTKLVIATDVAGVARADIYQRSNTLGNVKVVKAPSHPRTGERFHRVTLDADKRASHCDTIHVAKVQDFQVLADGSLSHLTGQVYAMHDAVSDADVAHDPNPKNVLEESALRALLATLHKALIDPLITKVVGRGPVQKPPLGTGGAVSKSAMGSKPFVSPLPKDIFKKPKCPECFDTGLTNGLIHSCSKGCPIK